MGGQRLRDPDRDAHGDAQVASGAGQVLHPTYEAGQSMRDPDDYFTPWEVLGCGASVEDEDVVLLGSLVDRAADWLEARGATRLVRAN